jgi:CDP-paratose 2-epimerase
LSEGTYPMKRPLERCETLLLTRWRLDAERRQGSLPSAMRLLITGACGFVGSQLAIQLKRRFSELAITAFDNLARRGSESNIAALKRLGCSFVHGDVRQAEDLVELPPCDLILDCAANPSVLAGVGGGTSQLIAHNLVGTLNLLEKCRRDQAGLVMLSSSRVYSIDRLNDIPLVSTATRFAFDEARPSPAGCSLRGISESFSTDAPISLYGATKLASEVIALEYGAAFGLPIWIDRCGVIAGAGQFGRIDQGIFSYWIYQWLLGNSLSYIGYGGTGQQVRDFISPADLAELIEKQIRHGNAPAPRIINVDGGLARSLSLAELSTWCREHLGPGPDVKAIPDNRRYDVPHYVTDTSLAEQAWQWSPQESVEQTLEGIARWAREHREMLAGFAA